MSTAKNTQWPFVSTDKRPLFFNPQPRTQTAPEWHEPWSIRKGQSRKRRRSEVEEEATCTIAEPGLADQGQPARKVRITPAYRASRNKKCFRVSDLGEYVIAWACRIFSKWMISALSYVEDCHEIQRAQSTGQVGDASQHATQTSTRDLGPDFMEMMQEMQGEVAAFKWRKDKWKTHQQNTPPERMAGYQDVEMEDAYDDGETLGDELLHLRRKYNVLGERALENHAGDDITFFTEEELSRPHLLSRQETRTVAPTNQANARDEDEEEAIERRPMPGTYPPSPSKHGMYHSKSVEPRISLPEAIASNHGPPTVPEGTGHVAIKGTEDDTSGLNSQLEQPDLLPSYPTRTTLPAHLIPTRVPGSLVRIAHKHEHPRPFRQPTGTADTYDQRRVLLRTLGLRQNSFPQALSPTTSNTPTPPQGSSPSSTGSEQPIDNEQHVTETRTTVNDPIEEPEASSAPSVPVITIEPPSDPSRSLSPPASKDPLPQYLSPASIPRRAGRQVRKPKKRSLPREPTKRHTSSSAATTSAINAAKPAQKLGVRSGIPGLGNSILGKKKTSSHSSEPWNEHTRDERRNIHEGSEKKKTWDKSEKTDTSDEAKERNTSNEPEKPKDTSNNLDDITVCPECTFANPAGTTSCAMCEAAFEEEDAVKENDTFSFPTESDDHIVTYRQRDPSIPANPDHFVTGGAGPSGTLDPLENPIPISRHEAERLLRERRRLPRLTDRCPYYTDEYELDETERNERLAIIEWERRKQARRGNLGEYEEALDKNGVWKKLGVE
ncbi:hypothetical protein DE146DRAFT_760875 [Phaeosphaeria sp. MPI-PUGE-AT-0046c]|nr:hypothetical protein DE146DRAFT_760875 [Phaeosphaeria sp. MPI-PUGE-AT-0046c]